MRKLLFAIAIAGLLVSGYLSITYITGGPIRCGGHAGCDVVRASDYANLLGIPTPLYGVVFYLLLAFCALALTPTTKGRVGGLLYVLTGIGLLTSAALMYISKYIIEAWCLWCVASAILSLLAFMVVWTRLPRYNTQL